MRGQSGNAAIEVFAAGFASGLTSLYANPLEVAKTKLQVTRSHLGKPRYTSSAQALYAVYAEGGVRGLYQGLSALAAYRIAMNGTRLGLYRPLKRLLRAATGIHEHSAPIDIGASSLTGAIGAVAGNPFQVIKARTMMTRSQVTSLAVTTEVLRSEGLPAFFRGITAAIPRVSLASAAQLATYDMMKRVLAGSDDTSDWRVHFVASLVASAALTTVYCPFDIASTRLYAPGRTYSGLVDCLMQTVRHEGVFALQRGWLAVFVNMAPSSTLTLLIWEALTFTLGATIPNSERGSTREER